MTARVGDHMFHIWHPTSFSVVRELSNCLKFGTNVWYCIYISDSSTFLSLAHTRFNAKLWIWYVVSIWLELLVSTRIVIIAPSIPEIWVSDYMLHLIFNCLLYSMAGTCYLYSHSPSGSCLYKPYSTPFHAIYITNIINSCMINHCCMKNIIIDILDQKAITIEGDEEHACS